MQRAASYAFAQTHDALKPHREVTMVAGGLVDDRKFINHAHPQTLYIATILLYVNAVFGLLGVLSFLSNFGFGFLGVGSLFISLGIVAAAAGGAYGIANEKKWGYYLGLGSVIVPAAYLVIINRNPFVLFRDPINLLLTGALIALLLHPQSREYEKIWFK